VFGVDQGRKEFENVLKSFAHPPDRLHVYQEWTACARAAHEALSGKASERDRQKSQAYQAEVQRVLEVIAEEFPGDRCDGKSCKATVYSLRKPCLASTQQRIHHLP
jgi:hypothetical protein